MPDFNDIPTGLRVPTQIPLDVKSYVSTLSDLIDLGVDNNKAFTYYEGFRAYCVENNKTYIWREALPEYGTAVMAENFIYPNDLIVYGVDYSGREFNFYEVPDSINQNNIVKVIYVNENDLPIGFNEQDICDYVLNLTEPQRTIDEIHSKHNIVIGPINEDTEVLDINYIYEIINIGKGVIVYIEPSNLLLIERTFAKTKIKEAVVYFTRAQVIANGFRLIHNLGVVRYLAEHFSYSNEMFGQQDVATLTPLEMIDKGLISVYNYLDPNEIEIEGFINYKPFISNNDIIAYYVRYIGADAEEIIVPNKMITYYYDNTRLPALNSYYISYNTLTGGLYTTYGSPIKKIRITQLPSISEITLNDIPLNINDIVLVDDINNEDFSIWIDKQDGSGPTGNYTDLFKYIVIDELDNESNEVEFNFNAIDEIIPGLVYLDDSPLSKNFNYTAGSALTEFVDLLEADLLVNVVNSFGNPTVGVKIYSLPSQGEISENGWPVTVGYVVPLIEIALGNFKFWALGVDGLGPVGTFATSFTFKLIDNQNYESNLVTFNINANQNIDDYIAQISWSDTNTFEQRTGVDGIGNVELDIDVQSVPIGDSIVLTTWQVNVGGSGWIDLMVASGTTQILDSLYGMNQYRIKVETALAITYYSNIIEFLATAGGGSGSDGSSTPGSSSGSGSGGSSDGGGNDPIEYS